MKPQPVVVTTICSECGLAWEAHGDKPTTSDCIRLLKAELAKRPTVTVQPCIQPYPYPVTRVLTGGSSIRELPTVVAPTRRPTRGRPSTARQPW